jgi:hypothetical protein
MSDMSGKFYWPSAEYSTPAELHCWHVPPSPNADFRCIRREGHPGQHYYAHSPTIRPWSHKDIEPDGWVRIVKCPTDGSVYTMRLPDGAEYVGRWGVTEQRWLRRAGPQLYKDTMGETVEHTVWSMLPDGAYPSHFKPL